MIDIWLLLIVGLLLSTKNHVCASYGFRVKRLATVTTRGAGNWQSPVKCVTKEEFDLCIRYNIYSRYKKECKPVCPPPLPPPPPPCQYPYPPPTVVSPALYPLCTSAPDPPFPAPAFVYNAPRKDARERGVAIAEEEELTLCDNCESEYHVWQYDVANNRYVLIKQFGKTILTTARTKKELNFKCDPVPSGINFCFLLMQSINVLIKALTESGNCIDGDMTILTLSNDPLKVSSLQVKDVILGLKDGKVSECNVLAVYPTNSDGVTYEGFTQDHLIVYGNDTVAIAGQKGEGKKGPIYTLMTDCDATYNTNGDLFTPISAAFCPQMPWADYFAVLSAIRKVMAKTGNFWFDLKVYYDNPSDPLYSNFMEALPELCRETLQCSKYKKCDQFEKTSSNFFTLHLNPTELEIVQKAFPNLGSDLSVDGTISAAVLENPTATGLLWQGILLLAVVTVILIGMFLVADNNLAINKFYRILLFFVSLAKYIGSVAFFLWRFLTTKPSIKVENDAQKDQMIVEEAVVLEIGSIYPTTTNDE